MPVNPHGNPHDVYFEQDPLMRRIDSVLERGPRRLLAWGGALFISALGVILLCRFAAGTIGSADLVALGGVVMSFAQWMHQRHTERMGSRA